MMVDPKPWDYRPFTVSCAICGTQHTVKACDREPPTCSHCSEPMTPIDAKPEDRKP